MDDAFAVTTVAREARSRRFEARILNHTYAKFEGFQCHIGGEFHGCLAVSRVKPRRPDA